MSKQHHDSPAHPILDKPWQYQIIRFDLCHNPEDYRAGHLDLWLKRDNEVCKLRFLQPTSIKIEEGFPSPTHGMIILDVRHLGWEDIGVQVADFEASNGSVTFYAKEVIEIGA